MRLLFPALLLAACSSPPPAKDRVPVRVEYSGCAEVLEGPVCVLGPERRVSLWVRDVPGVRWRFEGGEADEGTKVQDGRRYALKVAVGVSALTITPRDALGRWSLALRASTPPPPVLAEALALRKAKKPAEGIALLEAALPSLGRDRGIALGLIGRMEHDRNHSEVAYARLREAVEANAAAGRASKAVDDSMALAFFTGQRGLRIAEARAALRRAAELAEGIPRALAQLPYYGAIVDRLAGDLRGALDKTRVAVARAERLGNRRRLDDAREGLAGVLRALGRAEESSAISESLRSAYPPGCRRAQSQNNLAFLEVLRCEREGQPCPEAVARLEAALSACPENGIVRLTLAHALIVEGALPRARALLEIASEARGFVGSWREELLARADLKAKAYAAALRRYRALAERSERDNLPLFGWRAALGLARAHAAAGQVGPALGAYVAAEAKLDDLALALPLQEGRERFLGDREAAASEHMELLLGAGRVADAMQLARRSRVRVLRGLQRAERLQGLSPPTRARWEKLIANYRREGRSATPDRARMARLLDEAFGVLALQPSPPLPPPAEGQLLLAYHPLVRGWALFGAWPGGLAVHLTGAIDPRAPPAQLTAALLDPFANQIAASRQLRVLPYGALRALDFHALPWRGERLIEALPVVYPVDLPGPPQSAGPGAGIVVDPRGDLPGAWREASAVRAGLDAAGREVTTLEGAAASERQVKALLAQVDTFHYAGHGVFAGRGGWESALTLADGRLTVSDILALPRVPRRIVLSGCETGRDAEDAPLASVGLAQAFLAAGAEEVVAASRPVADELATALGAALYRQPPGMPLADALARAQTQLIARGVPAGGPVRGLLRGDVGAKAQRGDWAAFRALAR